MKTLKKTLCLVLAVVMVVGVLIIPANAAYDDFTDVKTVKHPVAAEMLTKLSIFTGYSDTTFGPGETLTRAQGATLIARALLKPATAAKLPAVDSFKDVTAAFGWAAGPINFCMQQGIVSGHGNGIFDPNGELTGYQLAKMLLVAMKYGEGSKYEGAGYEMKVFLDADQAGLFKNITGVDFAKPITRDDAAQMLFNAIDYDPTGGSSEYVVFVDTDSDKVLDADEADSVAYRGTNELLALAAAMQDTTRTLIEVTKKEQSIGYKNFGLQSSTYTDNFKRTFSSYKANDNIEVVAAGNPAVKYEGVAATYATLSKDLGYSTSENKAFNITVITDGVAATEQTIHRRDTGSVGALGALTEVYKTSTDHYTVYVMNTYVHELTAGEVQPFKPADATHDAEAAHILLPNKAGTAAQLSFKTADYNVGDVVIYTIGQTNAATTEEKVVDCVKASYIVGNISRKETNGVVTIGGQTYKWAAKAPTAITSGTYNTVSAAPYAYYLDFFGNLIYATATPATAPIDQYVYLVDWAAYRTPNVGGDHLFEAGTSVPAQAQAKVIDLTTGNLMTVNLALTIYNNQYHYVNADGTLGPVVTTVAAGTPFAAVAGMTDAQSARANGNPLRGLHTFKVQADGTYAITFDKAANTAVDGNVTIWRGIADLGATVTSTHLVASSTTEVVVATLSYDAYGNVVGAVVTPFTGYQNFPSAPVVANSASKGLIISYHPVTKVASKILVVNDPISAEAYNYAIYLGLGGTVWDPYTSRAVQLYRWVVNGAVQELSYSAAIEASSAYTDIKGTTSTGIVKNLTVEDGEVIACSAVPAANHVTATTTIGQLIIVAESGYMAVGTVNNVTLLADGCVFLVRSGASGSYTYEAVSALTAGYTVRDVYVNSLNAATLVIVEAPAR